MPNFMFAYHAGKDFKPPEDGAAQMARWNAWVTDLGDAMVNPGTPLGKSWTISASGAAEGGGSNPLMGYSVVAAESIEAALEIAKSCPFVDMGTIEVAQAMEMSGG